MNEIQTEIVSALARISLPGKNINALSFCGTSLDELKDYLEHLPHTSSLELCKIFYRIVPEVAALSLAPSKKLALLDLLNLLVPNSVEDLSKKLTLNASTTKMISLGIATLRSLSAGYKGALANMLQNPDTPPSLLVKAIYPALCLQSQLLMLCWENAIAPPPNTWRELHSIYTIARLKNVHSTKLTIQREGVVNAMPKAAYTKPLLIACLDPYRFPPMELRQIAAYLDKNWHLVEFTTVTRGGIFTVDSQGDQGPSYNSKTVGATSRHFRLRTVKLVDHLQENAQQLTRTGALSKRLITELGKYWSEEVKRRENPSADQTPVEIVVGLNHIHRQLTGCTNLAEFAAQLQRPDDIPKLRLSVLEQELPDHRDTFYKRNLFKPTIEKKEEPNFPHPVKTGEKKTTDLRLFTGQCINVSREGACIELPPPCDNLVAGELLAFKTLDDSHWHLAVIRWTRVTPELVRRLGIQLLAGTQTPCIASAHLTATNDPKSDFPALLLMVQGERQLILPTPPFKEYSTIVLRTQKGRKVLQLLRAKELTAHFGCFNIQVPP